MPYNSKKHMITFCHPGDKIRKRASFFQFELKTRNFGAGNILGVEFKMSLFQATL